MKKCAKGDRQEHPANRERGIGTVTLSTHYWNAPLVANIDQDLPVPALPET